jgi:hypothetical protein
MKTIGQLQIIDRKPILLISHYDLCAIQHIVDIAPQEAQWFHRVERLEVEDSRYLYYKISEMYIPDQYVSAAEVESEADMMVQFYKDLVEEHGSEKTNEIMKNLTAWAHSHHNMGVNPSGQDSRQFEEQVKNATEVGVTEPQIMLIFNKKDQFYSRVYDPSLGFTFENVDLIVTTYDFDNITEEAKKKFKKRPAPPAKKYTKPGGSGKQGVIEWSSPWEPSGWNRTDSKKKQRTVGHKGYKPKGTSSG